MPVGARIPAAYRGGNSCKILRAFRPFTSAGVRSRHRLTTTCSAEPQAAKEAKAAGRMTYRPESYAVLVQDVATSVLAAIEDGIKLMEVEFPAVPANIDGEATPPHELQGWQGASLRMLWGHCFVYVPLFCLLMCPAAYKGSSDLYIDSNIQLAVSAARQVCG